eukprot:Trichotokara_eunicae@DN3235_c0_g1_i2.p1
MFAALTSNFKSIRQGFQRVVQLGYVVFSALMLWRGLMVLTGSPSPVVVVLSGSMEPGLYRGDLLILSNPTQYHAGRDIPIVHRIVELHEDEAGHDLILTKGDNNHVDDRGLYDKGQLWITEKEVMGVARAYLPQAGLMTIWLNDYPFFKYAVIGIMVLLVLQGKD